MTPQALHLLVHTGFVEERCRKKGRTWRLSAATCRLLGDKAGYLRRCGFEPLQQEQMVLQYMAKLDAAIAANLKELAYDG